jgi:hypothetical protein
MISVRGSTRHNRIRLHLQLKRPSLKSFELDAETFFLPSGACPGRFMLAPRVFKPPQNSAEERGGGSEIQRVREAIPKQDLD